MSSALRCPHLPPCPGCPRFGAPDPDPLSTQTLSDFCVTHGARFTARVGARLAFRHRARLSVRGRAGAAKIGIFAEGSHRVVDIPRCEIHHPLINTVAVALKASIRELRATCYADVPHAGLVRALQVAVERPTQTAQVVLVCNEREPAASVPLLNALTQRLGAQLHSLWWNGNPERTNVVLGPHLQLWHGPEVLHERLGGADVFFPPAAFGQNNLELFDALLEQIHADVPPDRDVVELYAGAGAIGLGLCARSRSVVFNELGEASLAGLARGLEALPEGIRERARVLRGSAEVAADAIHGDSVVIVDPPRKGLEPTLLAALSSAPPERLIYVSCGLASFVRDAEVLIRGGLVLESATAYDLFPYTPHIETLAFFRRSAGATQPSPAQPSATPFVAPVA